MFLKRLLLRSMLSAIATMAVAYVVDYGVFHYRVTKNHQPYGQYTVYSYDAVPQKSGKTQFIFNAPEVETCVNALFPRQGYAPCWYLRQHTQAQTNF